MRTKLVEILLFIHARGQVVAHQLKSEFNIFSGNPVKNRDLDVFLRFDLVGHKYSGLDSAGEPQEVIFLGNRAKRFLQNKALA